MPGETVLSWLGRLADAHHLPVRALPLALPASTERARDVIAHGPLEEKLSALSGLPVGLLRSAMPALTYRDWVTQPPLWLRDESRPRMTMRRESGLITVPYRCTACLRDDGARLARWAHAPFLYCTEHEQVVGEKTPVRSTELTGAQTRLDRMFARSRGHRGFLEQLRGAIGVAYSWRSLELPYLARIWAARCDQADWPAWRAGNVEPWVYPEVVLLTQIRVVWGQGDYLDDRPDVVGIERAIRRGLTAHARRLRVTLDRSDWPRESGWLAYECGLRN